MTVRLWECQIFRSAWASKSSRKTIARLSRRMSTWSHAEMDGLERAGQDFHTRAEKPLIGLRTAVTQPLVWPSPGKLVQ